MPTASAECGLTVAVTGPTGTFGFGLVPLLQADGRIERIIGTARRPFDPAARGWSKWTTGAATYTTCTPSRWKPRYTAGEAPREALGRG
jgi:hypothetical protein